MVAVEIRQNFESYLNSLRTACFRASENHAIWRIYQIDRLRHYEIMNEYYGFFSCSIHAHFVATLVALGILYKNKNDSCNLHDLISYAEKYALICPPILEKQKHRLQKVQAIADNLWKIRSKTFAHTDKQLSYEQVLKKFPFKPKELTQLIKTAHQILKDIFHHFGDDLGNLQQGARKDTLALFAVLKKAKKRNIKKPKPAGRPNFLTKIMKEANLNGKAGH